MKLTEIYNVSADYILLGAEKEAAVPAQEKRELEEEFSDDSAEYQFSQYILDKVKEGLAQEE